MKHVLSFDTALAGINEPLGGILGGRPDTMLKEAINNHRPNVELETMSASLPSPFVHRVSPNRDCVHINDINK